MVRLNKKIKAFTISEMLVVLVISGIVISLTMLILNLVQKQLKLINTNNDRATEIRLLERALWQDVNRHDLLFDKNKQQLFCVSVIDTVTYSFKADYTIRNTDTLKIPVFNTTIYLEGVPTTNTNIDALELQLSKKNQGKNLFIYKIKDASFYMNDHGI